MPYAAQRRPRPGALVAVGALHLAGLVLLVQLRPWGDHGARLPEPAPLWVRLLDLRPPPPQAAAAPRSVPTRRHALPARQPQAAAPEPQPISQPGPAPTPAPSGAVPDAAAVATPAASAPSKPLDLRLPLARNAPWRQRSPAQDDPRANTRPETFEEKIAGAMGGDGVWRTERIDYDHMRLQRGDTCVDLQRTRAQQIDPMSPHTRDLPWLAGRAYRCR
ncbi:MAG: hypothetical protein KGN16_17940 [Burkholderiales bacterium]|nr:hypothetical protein [Burkholderiales bacterium]